MTPAELLPQVYDELRKLAAAKLLAEAPGHTLDATALVHEAWLKLADVPLRGTNRVVELRETNGVPDLRLYRVTVPAQP